MVALLRGARRAAVIVNAGDHKDAEGRAGAVDLEISSLTELGLSASELDLRSYFGRADALRSDLASFDLLWARGGNAFNLRRAFRQSGLDVLLPSLLAQDSLVYGGYSAGVVVLAPTLHDLEMVDDPEVILPGYEPEVIWDGLGVIPYSVAPHYRSDHPETEAIERLVQRWIDGHVLFKALRDGEAIVVDGESETVAG